jgi:2-keto-4-pentenoate hydratase/2-oxohepta-3-ene-1,7-dioic acid hydratase in catechol pathway
MRVFRYRVGKAVYWGEQIGEDVLARCVRLPSDKLELKHAGYEDQLSEVELLAPVAPSKIICVGRNYAEHAKERGAEVPEKPLLFFKPPSCLIPHGGAIRLPAGSERVDFEGEIALVIGERCSCVPEERAYDYLYGVTAFNDVTARDWQQADGQWARAKGLDTFGPCGPHVDTSAAEALRLGRQLQDSFISQTGNIGVDAEKQLPLSVATYVNGEQRQFGSVAELTFGFAHLISYISSLFTLEPGDLIVTGTPAGVGPLSPGDEVAVELSCGVRLSNTVVGPEG